MTMNNIEKITGDDTNISYKGIKLKTGSSVTVSYIHRKEKAKNYGSRFGQD